jgi:TFIIF-interacting CTD phosphatase-like protein
MGLNPTGGVDLSPFRCPVYVDEFRLADLPSKETYQTSNTGFERVKNSLADILKQKSKAILIKLLFASDRPELEMLQTKVYLYSLYYRLHLHIL